MDRYLSVIYLLLEQGKVEDAMEELERRKLEITRNLLFDTGYPILNSVLTYKFQIAQEKNIHPQLFWNLKEEIQVNLTDLAVIIAVHIMSQFSNFSKSVINICLFLFLMG